MWQEGGKEGELVRHTLFICIYPQYLLCPSLLPLFSVLGECYKIRWYSDLSVHQNYTVVQSLSCVRLSVTPWTAAPQASLPFTISQSLLKLMSFESVVPSNHLVLCCFSPPTLSLSQHQGLFQ